MSVYENILVPVDYSGGADTALHHARLLAVTFGSKVDVLHVWKAPITVPPEPGLYGTYPENETAESMAEREAEIFLDALFAKVELEGDDRFNKITEPGSPSRVILERAECYDLIIMGTHGRRGLKRVVLGSVAERVVRRAACPVLVVHSD